MAKQPSTEDQGNSFSNDGSFMEQFKKMAEHKTKEEQAKREKEEAEKQAKISKPLFSRVTKTKPVVMKLGGFRKKLLPGAKMNKPKVFVDDEAELNNNQGNSVTGQVTGQVTAAGTATSTTPAITGNGLSSSGHTTVAAGPPVKKKSRFSDGPTPGVMCGSTPGPSDTAGAPPANIDPPVRKRKSRFSDTPPSTNNTALSNIISSFSSPPVPTQQSLSETQKQQILEQIEMNKLVAEIKAATQSEAAKQSGGGATYDYDSDEDTEGGTWEHKLRTSEMMKTYEKAREITVLNQEKHHIGDFLPPQEMEKFIEKVSAIKEGRTPDFSDYKEHKLTEENVGFKLLQKSGWSEGSGLGSNHDGIVDPINKGKASFDQSGVGATPPAEVAKSDSDFEVYRKRMMLAYRFRPNPLNNPRRPYY